MSDPFTTTPAANPAECEVRPKSRFARKAQTVELLGNSGAKKKKTDLNPVQPTFIGQRFGRWTVINEAPRKHGRRWLCRCDCGSEGVVFETPLRAGRSKSCGCWRDERATRHGETAKQIKKSAEYRIWSGMHNRCSNPRNQAFKNYGGRGIVVCDRWKTFELFLEDMGRRLSTKHSIDRKDNDGSYSPENCRWATDGDQSRNTRQTHWLTFNGETRCLSDWAVTCGMHKSTLLLRLKSGWSVERALTEKVHKR